MQQKQEAITFGINISQKDSGLVQFLENRGRFLSVYINSLSIILPEDAQGSQNIIMFWNSHMGAWIFKLRHKSSKHGDQFCPVLIIKNLKWK